RVRGPGRGHGPGCLAGAESRAVPEFERLGAPARGSGAERLVWRSRPGAGSLDAELPDPGLLLRVTSVLVRGGRYSDRGGPDRLLTGGGAARDALRPFVARAAS